MKKGGRRRAAASRCLHRDVQFLRASVPLWQPSGYARLTCVRGCSGSNMTEAPSPPSREKLQVPSRFCDIKLLPLLRTGPVQFSFFNSRLLCWGSRSCASRWLRQEGTLVLFESVPGTAGRNAREALLPPSGRGLHRPGCFHRIKLMPLRWNWAQLVLVFRSDSCCVGWLITPAWLLGYQCTDQSSGLLVVAVKERQIVKSSSRLSVNCGVSNTVNISSKV